MNENLGRLLSALSDGDNEAFSNALNDVTDLSSLHSDIVKASQTIVDKGTFSAEDVEQVNVLADVADKVNEAIAERAKAEAETAEAVASAMARIQPQATDETTETDTDTDTVEVPDTPAELVEQEATVVASGKPAAAHLLKRLAQSSNPTEVVAAKDEKPFLVANANVPGMVAGEKFRDFGQVGEFAVEQWRRLTPAALNGRSPAPLPLATFSRRFPQDMVSYDENVENAVKAAASESRLPGGNLVAAGGWCAPSETLYDLCVQATRTGLLSVPEIQAMRGGVRFSAGPDFASVYTNTGFIQTEAEAIAATEKPCFEVPCPSFTDVRLDVVGVCVTAGILQNAGYPEAIETYIEQALTAHVHRVNARRIAQMIAGSTTVNLTALAPFTNQGATSGVLEAVELQIEDMRNRNRLNPTATVEVVLPTWVRGVMRADLSKRPGYDGVRVNDALLNEYFADRHANVQYVYDFQDAFVDAGVGMGGATPATGWPAFVRALIFPAGTWVSAMKNVITLDAGIYDSTNITTNKYTALFTEEGEAMLKRCHDSRYLVIPLCASGAVAMGEDLGCAQGEGE